ncbi:MAG: succinylglutamate desuccinylase/aspartoacylase family protein [Rickettsiaceae bacterium]|nr:succinylglutamate desuccinylase/aspartoacylase family protein [Rickettsiaceae bacterium]
MYKDLTIDGVTIKPGQRKRFEMDVAQLFDHTSMTIPVEVIRGKEDGPTIFLSAAIHGDELNGVEVIRRLLSHKKLFSKIKGTIIAVPIVNIFGYNQNTRYLPDRRDLNRSFPGSKQGSLASQIAQKFMTEIVEKCDYGIDLHTGSVHRYNMPQIRVLLDNPETKELAESFGVPVVLSAALREGSLRQAAATKGVKVLVFEGGEALRYDEKIIRSAKNGIIATLCSIGILDKELVSKKLPKNREVFYANSSHWIRAPHSGSLHIRKKIGSKVRKDETLGIISDPFGIKQHYVKSTSTGIVIGIAMMPLVNNGDALFHIATFDDAHAVASVVAEYDEAL